MSEQEPKYDFENGQVINRSSGEVIPSDEPVFILRGRDRLAVVALVKYYGEAVLNGVDQPHLEAVHRRVNQFLRFSQENPDRMKSPDTEPWWKP